MPPSTTPTTPGTPTSPGHAIDTETSQRVLRQFRLVFSSVRRHFQRIEKTVGMGSAQIWALSLIAQHPGLGITQLAQAMDIHQSTASNLVRALIQSGLVQNEKSAVDKRVAELYPLPAGLKALKKAPGPFSGVLPSALDELDAQTLQHLEQGLAKLIQKIDVDAVSAQTPMALM